MASELHEFLSQDHDRLDLLLSGCLGADGSVEADMFAEFREGLLRHIGIEEKVLFPELRKRKGITPLEEQLHTDHAALAALLVPPPRRAEIETIREILTLHNPLRMTLLDTFTISQDDTRPFAARAIMLPSRA